MEKWKEIQQNLLDFLKEAEENVTDFSLEGIKTAQSQLKDIENKIKEAQERKKLKTISISEDVHTEIKKYCALKEEKMGEWVEKVLLEAIK
jgi:vacuolar-type H+-ATPase subunit F/Vma7